MEMLLFVFVLSDADLVGKGVGRRSLCRRRLTDLDDLPSLCAI